jgi:6-phosphogluconolactonase (cycloisomerase 2 family)
MTRPFLKLRWDRLATLATVFWLGAMADLARSDETPPPGTIYVQSNVATSPGNQILAYRRDAQGNLTPVEGSPFSAGGAGISPSFNLGPYDSDQEIITNPDHTRLFATNGGSNSIAVFKFKSDGSLVPIAGSPFSSGGSNPVGLALTGDKMVVVNQDNDPGNPGQFLPSYSTLQVNSKGQLKPIAGAAFTVDLGSSPSQALVPPEHPSLVFGCDFLGGLLRSFELRESGQLVPIEVQALPADEFALSGTPALPLGLWSHPKLPIFYVGFVTINRLGVYRYNAAGQFEFLRTVPDTGNGVCWIRSNKEGTRLYTSNTADPSISVYDISRDPTEPVQIQKVVLNEMSNVYQITLDPAEEFFYAVTQRNSAMLPASANALHVLKIGADGKLTEVPSSPTLLPVPASSRPQGVLAF